MPYLICNECEIYYEIEPDFNPEALKTCEKCGLQLKYYENFDDYYNNENINPNAYEDEKNFNTHSKYAKITTAGFILAIIGLFVFILAYVSPIFWISQSTNNFKNPNNLLNLSLQIIFLYITAVSIMAAGVLTYLYGKRNGKITKTRVNNVNQQRITVKKNSTANYFKNLPEGYFILNNLKIRGKRIKINHVVVGPTGIFLIHINNLRGHYVINENKWMDDIGKIVSKTILNPQQVKLNAIELKRFLDSKNLNIDYIMLNSIVAFPNNNFTVRKMPRTYTVMNTREISNFIANSKVKMDLSTITEAVVLLEHYCSDIARI
jgi:ABC-type multidrug transport system fused ATPase/permease subunit